MSKEDQVSKLMIDLIDYINKNQLKLEGPYKAAALRSAAAYYDSLTQAESMLLAIGKAFNVI